MTGAPPGAGAAAQHTDPAERNKRPSIYAVARHAGVSHQTVSRVLNDIASVRPTTRQRVLAAIDELGYSRNAAARSLNTRRSSTLGVVVLNEELHGPAQAVRQIERAAREAGYGLRITYLSAVARRTIKESVRSLQEQMADAVLVIDPHPEDWPLLEPIERNYPLVMVGGSARGVPGVRYASADGISQAVSYLLSLGHETVHHVAGPAGWAETDVRREAWAETLRTAGRAVPEPVAGDWTAASGYAAGRVLAARGDVTAVLAGNDHMALGLMRAFTEAGQRIPEDVSIVGFDNIPDSAYYMPPLTTLSQAFDELGTHAVQLAVEQIAAGHRDRVRDVVLEPPMLVLRSSTAPAPRANQGC